MEDTSLTKICCACNTRLPITYFVKQTRYDKPPYSYKCKQCTNSYNRQYYHQNKKNELFVKKAKTRFLRNYAKRLMRAKEIRLQNPEPSRIANRKCYDKHKISRSQYATRNRKRINDRIRKRKKKDINFRVACNYRGRIWDAIKNNKKSGRLSDLLGCDIQALREHLESKFYGGMSWNNYGFYGWHIDHIKPCVSFNLSDPLQQKACFHYSNLQPLWARDNMSKGDKIL